MEIDVRKTAGEISPLWFGHNLEHTRSCLWQGLSAQLVRNRKFAGFPGRHCVARHWHRVGSRGCLYLPEMASEPFDGKPSMEGETYTAHFDPAIKETSRWGYAAMQRQRMQNVRQGATCGIGQRGIFLIGGKEYAGALALLSDRELPVRIRVTGHDSAPEHFETTVTVGPEGWAEHQFNFVPPASDEDARIEITFEEVGAVYVGAASLLPADHFHGMRRDVIELLKHVSVPLLRWPGGNFAGAYRWKDGLLPVNRRVPLWDSEIPNLLPHTDGYDDHEIGTDEFIALCRELEAEPSITINMSLEGSEEAAAWVEYCNGSAETKWGRLRAERGHPEPYDVKYWYLGNEMGYGHMRGPNTPRQYAEIAAACAGAMRGVDASIVLICSGTWFKEEWYRDVLAEIGDCFDHISYHEYTDQMKVFAGEEGRKEFRRIATAPCQTLEAMKEIRSRLDANAPGDKFVGISFDEWNVWYTFFRRPGVMEGMYTASMLNMFCRDASRVGMTMGAYFEPVNEGTIWVEPDACRLTPAGQVFSLFKSHQGNRLVEVQSSADTRELDVAASVSGAENEVTITLVNSDAEAKCEARISLKNVGGVASARGTVLTSPDFLPESEFSREELDVIAKDSHALTVTLPRHSVARIQFVCR